MCNDGACSMTNENTKNQRLENVFEQLVRICNCNFHCWILIRIDRQFQSMELVDNVSLVYVGDAELGHFTLFKFCRGRQRNVQRFVTHEHSYCFAH